MKNKEVYVYNYTVYWIKSNLNMFLGHLSQKSFLSKSEARRFAKDHKKDNEYVKPWIVRSICLRENFKQDIEVEIVSNQKEINSYDAWGNYGLYKKIKY